MRAAGRASVFLPLTHFKFFFLKHIFANTRVKSSQMMSHICTSIQASPKSALLLSPTTPPPTCKEENVRFLTYLVTSINFSASTLHGGRFTRTLWTDRCTQTRSHSHTRHRSVLCQMHVTDNRVSRLRAAGGCNRQNDLKIHPVSAGEVCAVLV